MDDDLDLLHGSDGPSRRPPWLLLTGVVVVALLTLAGGVWAIGSVVTGDDEPARAAAPTSTAAPTTAAPATARATVPPTTPAPTTTPAATPAATVVLPPSPVRSATVSAVPTTRRPTPKPTTAPPTPKPTASTPAPGLRAVPDVVGLKVTAATVTLRAAGFKVRVLGGLLTPDRDQRRVTAQRPTGGTLARVGSVVVLVSDSV